MRAAVAGARGGENRIEIACGCAVLGDLAGNVDLHEQVESASGRSGRLVQAHQKLRSVDRVDDVEAARGLRRLVRLKVADEVPPKRQVAGPIHLVERLLHLVLTEVGLSTVGGDANVRGVERLGDGNQADGGGIAVGPAGGARDAIANAGQPGAKSRGIDHFFSCATIAFAVGAFGPSGESFKYVSNSVAAPGRLFSLSSAIPS